MTRSFGLANLNVYVLLGLPMLLMCSCGSSGDSYGSGSGSGAGYAGSSSTTRSSGTSINGCEASTAEDMSSGGNVTIEFGGSLGSRYSPACVTVAMGQTVTWKGDFGMHPLLGGTASDTQATPDSSNPITAASGQGSSGTVTVQFANAGTFPYYCGMHWRDGMRGAVFVR